MHAHLDPIRETSQRRPAALSQGDAGAAHLSPPAFQLKADPVQREGMPEEEELQMKSAPLQRVEMPEEEELQMKAAPLQREGMPEEEELQMKAAPVQRETGSHSPTGLPVDVQTGMESSFDTDFSDVRIHPNSPQAPEVGALAYTQGSEIHFAPGQFDPGSSQGRELLGHELAHVVQQREGRVSPTGTVNGLPLNDDQGLEREADDLGRQAAQMMRRS